MLHAFIDESYTDKRYYQAAVVMKEEDLPLLDAALILASDFARGFGVGPGVEFHAHSLMSGRDGWEPVAEAARARLRIYAHTLNLISQLPARIFIEGVDIAKLNARYSYPDSPHSVTLRHLFEEINDFAGHHNRRVHVTCDRIGDYKTELRNFDFYKKVRNEGFEPSDLQHLESLTFGDSKDHQGLQAADQIVYLYRRMNAHTESNPKTERAIKNMWESLLPIVAKHRRWDP
jgi:hypothetical protein